MDLWLGNRKRIVVLNREDMISTADRNAWASYYAKQGTKVVLSNGQLGMVFESIVCVLFKVFFLNRSIVFMFLGCSGYYEAK